VVIYNGIPWFDDQANTVNAHGACVVEDNGRYYLFGEYKTDAVNHFIGFSCYSSDDLVNWKFERIVLPRQTGGFLGPNRIGERVKVMRCPSTGEYVMYMHTDNTGYNDPRIGYATSAAINGIYEFQGALLHNGSEIKKWDMGTFQDTDGTGYLLVHDGPVYRLAGNYRSVESQAAFVCGLGEAPAMFKKDDLYYFLSSHKTSWERNDNFYFTAPDITGPWTKQGLFAPAGSLAHNSQITFVFPFVHSGETTYMFMGDRWSFPRQASAATYVWIPLEVNGTALSIQEYWECWDVEGAQKTEPFAGGITIPQEIMAFKKTGDWQISGGHFTSNVQRAVLETSFQGTQFAVFGESNPHSGYAKITVREKNNGEILSSLVDFYCKYTTGGLRFVSPCMPNGDYTLAVEVTGDISKCSDKAGNTYGSDNSFISISEIRCRTNG